MSSSHIVVARVNGRPISQFDLDNAVQGYSMEFHRKTMDQLDAGELEQARDFALEKLLARELIFQDALARGIVATEADIEAEKSKIIANFPSEEEFYATLAKGGLSPEEYHRMIRQDVTVNLCTAARVEALPAPDEAEVENYYREQDGRMVRAGRVRASHILVRTDDKSEAEARRLVAELLSRSAGEDFAQLARQYSQCPSAPSGGDLGYFRRGDMVKPFEEAAFGQEVGVVGGPIATQFGLHLLKVTEREADVPMSLEESHPRIREILRARSAAEELRSWVAELREAARIEFILA